MPKLSAGIVLVRIVGRKPQFLLVHPGGPFWQRKDLGAWSIPKGEYATDEDPLDAARREFEEELGIACAATLLPLGSIRQAGGKVVTAWCAVGDIDVDTIVSNRFEIEWPPRSGRLQSFPEVDRAQFFDPTEAAIKIVAGQAALLERAVTELQDAGLL
ncbi:MAG: NUDIX domain-containing protein [Ilumatobacteraceae bacterium]